MADLTATRRVITFSRRNLHPWPIFVKLLSFCRCSSILALAVRNRNKSEDVPPASDHTNRNGCQQSDSQLFCQYWWVAVASNGTVDWTASAGDPNTYQVAFPFNPYPLSTVVVMP